MKKRLFIYGAGAIGRGYIPWVFPPKEFDYYYGEQNPVLRKELSRRQQFTTHKTKGDSYDSMVVPVRGCFAPGEEGEIIRSVDAVIIAVGPRNVLSLKESLANVTVPIICCENDSTIPAFMVSVTGNPNFLFAIPDVITSNTAPYDLLEKDPLSIVTENGVCYIDNHAAQLGGECDYVDPSELQKQWLAKLYIHNTPHCIAAYLGSLLGIIYLHESLENQQSERIVIGAMNEMQEMLITKFHLQQDFIEWYSSKEIQRFRNKLLFDPISRVAREPFRKLAPNERLIGAAELCISNGIVPSNILIGIMAAFCYENDNDPDFHIRYLVNSLQRSDFLKIIINLRPGEALFEMLLQNWDVNIHLLKSLKDHE